MAANITAISLQSTPSFSIGRPSLPRSAAKMAVALVVGALASFTVLEGLAVSQAVLDPVFNGAMVLLSRPMLPVGF
jgi:hypothetical protein